jgi:anti-anti-sigma regulatory factor
VNFPAPGTEVPVLRNRADEVGSDLRFDVIGGVVLIDASGELDAPMAQRLSEHLDQIRDGSRPVVLDLTRVTEVGEEALGVLRAMWRQVGDGMRVVAVPGSAPARALKAARLRRFAVHATLSGALTDASA